VSPGGRGLGVRRRFPETPLAPCDGDFLASAQTVSQAVNRITGEDSTQGHIFSCVRVAAAGPQRVNKQAVKRVHVSEYSSPTLAMSLAQAIRDVSCERGF